MKLDLGLMRNLVQSGPSRRQLPQLAEIEINLLRVFGNGRGAFAIDAGVRLVERLICRLVQIFSLSLISLRLRASALAFG
jgi:hypothetical protein